MPSFTLSLSVKTLLLGSALVFGSRLHAQVYKGAMVVDVADGQVLFEDHSDYVGPPASVTKLMTFLVVDDALKAGQITLQTPVTVTAEDARMGGTQVWLKQGEVFPVEELLYALLIQSANDAAHALSHAVAGSRDAFVAQMNARAQQLGLHDTIWRSPHGLPPSSRSLADSDLTSPRDLAVLSRVLLQQTDILRYTSVEKRLFGATQRAQPVAMDNHNNLIGKVHGVDGLKTGFTRAAGFCLSATAARNGHRIIAVIMGATTSQERDIKMAELIENAFTRFPPGSASGIVSAPLPAAPPVIQSIPLPAAAAPVDPAATTTEPTVKFVVPPPRRKN